MTTSNLAESFPDSAGSSINRLGVYGVAVATASGSSSAILVTSAAFAAGDDGSEMLVLLGAAAVTGAVAYALGRRPVSARSLRPVPALSAAVISFLVIAIPTLVYLATGVFDRIDDAFYESIAGVSTSALTLLEDPSEVGDGILIWRAGTQWMGGLAALALGVGLLPFLGGSRELVDPRDRRRTARALAPRPAPALRRVALIYGLATEGVVVAFVLAGMGFRDAVAHAFSSVSTGGFSTHADSIGHFDSFAIELVVIIAMAGAGSSIALVWMLWRRQFRDTRRAFELQLYCGAMVLATVWIWWLNRDIDDGAWRGLRAALFTVVSLVTTTGHSVSDWGAFHPGAVTLLLILMAIGGMAGSVAGGLRWTRVMSLLQFLWRELQRQLHPRSVRSVKVGSSPISEASVDRMHAQLAFMMTVSTAGAVALAFFGSEIIEAVSLAVSAVSTTGPGFSEGGTIATAADLSRPERLALMPLMLAGRVFLYPAFVLAGAAFFGASRVIASRRSSFTMRRARSRR